MTETITVNEWLARTKSDAQTRMAAVLGDGGTISIQASRSHYCIPRDNNLERYSHVEVMLLTPDQTEHDHMLERWESDGLYGWLPVIELEMYCILRGGIQWDDK